METTSDHRMELDRNKSAFWPIFENSRFPMTLLDADGRYVAVNDATVEFYGIARDDLIGQRPGRTLADGERTMWENEWETVRRTGELFNERVFERADGRTLRIRYAGHATSASGRWLALSVVLSARVEPGGPELVSPAAVSDGDPPAPARTRLTRREREIVRMVALGADTREVASQLYLSPETIRSHVRNAMSKTSARTRAHLVAIALSEGLLEE